MTDIGNPAWKEIETTVQSALASGLLKVPSEAFLAMAARSGFREGYLLERLQDIGTVMETEAHLLGFMIARKRHGETIGLFSGYRLELKSATHKNVTSNYGRHTPAQMIGLCVSEKSPWQQSAERLGLFQSEKERSDYFKDLEERAQVFADRTWRHGEKTSSASGASMRIMPIATHQSTAKFISGIRRATSG